jgi:hypothetical protein
MSTIVDIRLLKVNKSCLFSVMIRCVLWCGCVTCPRKLRDKRRPTVLGKRFELKMKEMTGDWRRLHRGDLNKL